MIKYKLLYDMCVETWKQDWEFSKTLMDKARTYILVIGLVFGYSIFSLDVFYSALEKSTKASTSNYAMLLNLASCLFVIYFICFAVALICTLISLGIKTYMSLPVLTEIGDFRKKDDFSDDDLEEQFYNLSKQISIAVGDNETIIERQARYLKVSSWLLRIGSVALILIGAIFAYTRLF